jgi:hypothetical protein
MEAFHGCSEFSYVTLGGGVEEIVVYAFSTCESLTHIVIPPAVKARGNLLLLRVDDSGGGIR